VSRKWRGFPDSDDTVFIPQLKQNPTPRGPRLLGVAKGLRQIATTDLDTTAAKSQLSGM
jgi:hypothetical protein